MYQVYTYITDKYIDKHNFAMSHTSNFIQSWSKKLILLCIPHDMGDMMHLCAIGLSALEPKRPFRPNNLKSAHLTHFEQVGLWRQCVAWPIYMLVTVPYFCHSSSTFSVVPSKWVVQMSRSQKWLHYCRWHLMEGTWHAPMSSAQFFSGWQRITGSSTLCQIAFILLLWYHYGLPQHISACWALCITATLITAEPQVAIITANYCKHSNYHHTKPSEAW